MDDNSAMAALAQAQVLISNVQMYLTGVQPPIPPIPPIPPNPPGVIVIPFGVGWMWVSAQNGGWSCEEVKVFQLDVPANSTAGVMRFAVEEYQYPYTPRECVLSRTAGSFDLSTAIQRQCGQIGILVDTRSMSGRYYFNVRNWNCDSETYSCMAGANIGSRVNVQPNVG